MHSVLASASAPGPSSSVAFPESEEDNPSPLQFSSSSSPPAMPPCATALNGEGPVPPPLVAAGRDDSGASSSRPLFFPSTTSSRIIRDDRELPRLSTEPVSIGNPNPPQLRLRTATSLPAGWYNSEVNGRSGYTSLRELIENSPTKSDAAATSSSPTYKDLHYSPPHTHHQHQQSRNQYSVTIDSIAIRNPLLKHAAFAYLRPTTPPAPVPKRSWLVGSSQPRGHPDDDGRSFAEAGEGFLCDGVGFVTGWIAGVVRSLFHRMCGRDGSGETGDRVKAYDMSKTNGDVLAQQQQQRS